jgi:hypothetical protein
VLLNFFIIHFFLILWSDCCYQHVAILSVCSYSVSHHTYHHISSSVNYFLLLSSLLLQSVVTQHSWCCEIVIVSCVDSLASVPPWNFVSKKKSSRTFYDTRTHFAELARACFHVSHVLGKSLMWVCCACVEERLAHRYARTRRAIPSCVCSFFLHRISGKFCSRDRVINAPCALPLRGFSPPVPGSILAIF